VVKEGHLIDIDFGVRVDGYCSDLQRCFYVLRNGETEAPEAARKGFAAITEGVGKAKRALKPGVTGVEIDTICRDHITGQGYANYGHALGHQVGRYAHDGTVLLGPAWERYGDRVHQPVEEGMIFTLEPSLKVEGYGPCAVEEMVVVTNDGCEYLSRGQQELILIG
jgi:Xaa-Pro aminopeptidase